MILEGDTLIPATRREVWNALNDPEVLRACIPGCQSLEQQSDTDFTASVRAAIGPVKATFGAKITLSEIEPDVGYTITGAGKGGAAGFARGAARVDLKDEDGGTRLSYRADVNVGGKLAQVGSRLIQGTAKKLAGEFFDCLSARLGGDPSNGVATTQAAAAATVAQPTTTAGGTKNRQLLRTGLIALVVIALIWWVAT